jgi:hypothetical protein
LLLDVSNIYDNSEKILKPYVTDMFMFPHCKTRNLMISVYRNKLEVNGVIRIFPSPNSNIALEGSANIIPELTATFPPVMITHKAT